MNQLSEDIRLLGELLGKTIAEQAGQNVFDLEEKIRELAKGRHGDNRAAGGEIERIVSGLVQDPKLTGDILKAFSTYFQLVNLAEEHERIRILQRRENEAFSEDGVLRESIPAAIETLRREGFDAPQVQAMLDQMLIMPVFTAHPTESRRRTIRQILELLSNALQQLRSQATRDCQRATLVEKIRDAITLLWQSDESRKRRLTVMDEVRNTGIYFFENTLFDVVPEICDELERALQRFYPDHAWNVPVILRFGSWIGGDRDGNPFVKNETTAAAIRAQKEAVLERYARDVRELYELLSPALGRTGFNAEFLRELRDEIAALPESEVESVERFHQEPYRQKLILIYRRLLATRNVAPGDERAFETPQQLLSELQKIGNSLRQNKGGRLAEGRLSGLIRRVQTFGFHLASLDIRQHSQEHQAAISEIFQTCGIEPGYDDLPEEARVELLARETASRRPLTARLDFSGPCNETVGLFRLIKQWHQSAGPESIQSYIISMTESVSDLLEVLLLMSDARLLGELDLVPLFETVDDLQAAPDIMARLFANPVYQDHLRRRGNRQQIMIGYSDSNKDGGFLRANWMLFAAQRQLARTCQDAGVDLTLFHGRGGSIGRGGGPANRAILAQPVESIRGRIRITEQGEVVSSRYSHNEIATRHLQQLFHAVICSTGKRPDDSRLDRWADIMDELGGAAFVRYRQLVENPDFIHYFRTATPIEHIDRLNLGSRPAKRKTTQEISDLRAIPWVFAWTQSRTNIPSWYGVGSACRQFASGEDAESKIGELAEMYADWPFFTSLMNNVHLGLGRADMGISELYSRLDDEQSATNLFADIRDEFELTRSFVLRITGHDEILDTEKWLQYSIRMRNPYVDPMNYIQVALLDRYRACPGDAEREACENLILQSVNGIAAGLQSVG